MWKIMLQFMVYSHWGLTLEVFANCCFDMSFLFFYIKGLGLLLTQGYAFHLFYTAGAVTVYAICYF